LKIILDKQLEKNKMTKYRLSQITGLRASTISDLCNGKRANPRLDTIERLCLALDCEPNDILVFEKNNIDD
jgi:putative transcriptional regulator